MNTLLFKNALNQLAFPAILSYLPDTNIKSGGIPANFASQFSHRCFAERQLVKK